MVEVILRRPIRKPARRAGGRPRKPESHSHVATIQGRVTPPEYVVFQRVLAERKAKGLPGSENATEWIRAVLHEQAVALGVPLPAEYHDVRAVRALNWERVEAPSVALDAGEVENCQTPGCPDVVGECGVLCDRCVDAILAKPLHATFGPDTFTKEAVLAAWEQSGKRVTKVADKLGVSYDAAHRWLKSLGVKFRHRGRPSLFADVGENRSEATAENVKQGRPSDAAILAAWEQSGKSITKTAISLGERPWTIRRRLGKLGAKPEQDRVLSAQLRARGRKIFADDTESA